MQQLLTFICSTPTRGYQARISSVYELNGALHVLIKMTGGGPCAAVSLVELTATVNTSSEYTQPVHFYVVSRQHGLMKYDAKQHPVAFVNDEHPIPFTNLASAAEFRMMMAAGRQLELPAKPLIPLKSLLTDKPILDIEVPIEILKMLNTDESTTVSTILKENPDCIPILMAMIKVGIFSQDTPVRNNHQFVKIVKTNIKLPEITRARLERLYQLLMGAENTPIVLNRAIHQIIYIDILPARNAGSVINCLIEIIQSMPPMTQTIADRLFSCTHEIDRAYALIKQLNGAGAAMHYLLSTVCEPAALYQFYMDFSDCCAVAHSAQLESSITCDVFRFMVDHKNEIKKIVRDVEFLSTPAGHASLDNYLRNEIDIGFVDDLLDNENASSLKKKSCCPAIISYFFPRPSNDNHGILDPIHHAKRKFE